MIIYYRINISFKLVNLIKTLCKFIIYVMFIDCKIFLNKKHIYIIGHYLNNLI